MLLFRKTKLLNNNNNPYPQNFSKMEKVSKHIPLNIQDMQLRQ